jgi:hypothetical protein
MTLPTEIIAEAIDTAELNRGVSGAAWLASPDNVPVTFDNGDIALFEHEGDKVFEGHLLFKSRGKQAVDHAREAFRRMFVDHGAEVLFGMIPHFRRDAKMVVRWAGARSAGLRQTSHGLCELFVLSNLMFFKGAAS